MSGINFFQKRKQNLQKSEIPYGLLALVLSILLWFVYNGLFVCGVQPQYEIFGFANLLVTSYIAYKVFTLGRKIEKTRYAKDVVVGDIREAIKKLEILQSRVKRIYNGQVRIPRIREDRLIGQMDGVSRKHEWI